jgi:hypothetical protein
MGNLFGGKSKKPSFENPVYGPPSYNTPWGSWGYKAGKDGSSGAFNSTLAAPEQRQLDLSQSAYYDIMKNLPTDGPFGSASLNNFNNPNSYLGAYNQNIRDVLNSQYGIPLHQRNVGRGVGNSTIAGANENDLNMKIGQTAMNQAANMAGTNYNSLLSGMTGVGTNINDIYKRMMGIAAQGRGQGQDYSNFQQTNANRDYISYLNDMKMWDETQQQSGGGLGDILGQFGLSSGGGGGSMDFLSGLLGGGDGGGFLSQLASMFGGSASPSGGIDTGYGAGFGQLSKDELNYQNSLNSDSDYGNLLSFFQE